VSKKPTAPTTKEPIKIGAILFLTGPEAVLGEEIKNGLVLANELDNEKAEQKIELVIEDSGGDKNKAISAYQKLRLEKIPIIISTGDRISYVLSTFANKDRVLLLGIAADSQEISGDYFFRGSLRVQKEAEILGDYAVKELNCKRIGVLYINDIYGESFRKVFDDTVRKNTGEIVSEESFGIVDSDVKTQILKTIQNNPDCISVSGFGPGLNIVFKQLREYGWNGITISTSPITDPYQFKTIGIENLNNTYFLAVDFDAENPSNEKIKEFVDRYKKRFSKSHLPGKFVAIAYDDYNILAWAIRECGYDAEKVKNCLLEAKDKQGILGPIDFSTHELKIPLYLKKVENGKIITIKAITE
jgi:branched-chain amino acid transport system substrate-binding protein